MYIGVMELLRPSEAPVARALVAPYERRARVQQEGDAVRAPRVPYAPPTSSRRVTDQVVVGPLRYGAGQPPVVEARIDAGIDPMLLDELLDDADRSAELLEVVVANSDDAEGLERLAALLAKRHSGPALAARLAPATPAAADGR